MVEVWIPYGETEVCISINAENFMGILEAKSPQPVEDTATEVRRALENPLSSPRLSEIAKSAKTACIAVNDRTQQWPLGSILEAVIHEMQEGQVDPSNITILVGSSFPPNVDEFRHRLGGDLASRLNVKMNDSQQANYVEIGATSRHTRVFVHSDYAAADVKVCVGALGFHSFLGYCGGPEDLISSTLGPATTLRMAPHALDHRSTIANLDQNPMQTEASEVAKLAGCNFHIDVLVDENGRLLRAVAGSSEEVFREGMRALEETYRASVERRPEIVVVSAGGRPHDSDFYSAHQAVDNITTLAKDRIVVVLVAECTQGHGDTTFLELLSTNKSIEDLREAMRRDFSHPLQAALRWLKIVEKHRIICVSAMPEYLASGVFRMRTTRTVADALEAAFRIAGRNSKVLVVPRGKVIVPYVTSATAAPQTTQG